MFGLDFQAIPVWLNLFIFAVAAVAIWFAGSRISDYGDTLADRYNLGKAFVGLLFLALATETPEIATTVTAALRGNAQLAVNNIFGGIVMQTAILAAADVVLVRGALTFFTPRPVLLLQGMFLIFLLGLALAFMVVGELATVGGVGLWTTLLLGAYLLTLYLSQRYEGGERWQPRKTEEETQGEIEDGTAEEQAQEDRHPDRSNGHLAAFFLLGTTVILVAGTMLALTGEALAEQTGLGASFVGATLLAFSTSLPELSTTIAAVRLGSYSLAVSNIFGSNSIMIALLFLSDLFYRGGPILNEVEAGAMFSLTMGIAVTVVYLIGLIERRNETIGRMGFDSVTVTGLYLVSLIGLYYLR